MSRFIQQMANFVVNKVLIEGLANSRTFQRFAVRTDRSLQELHKVSTEQLNKTFEELSRQQQQLQKSNGFRQGSPTANGPPVRPLTGFAGFMMAFVKEIQRDLGMTTRKH